MVKRKWLILCTLIWFDLFTDGTKTFCIFVPENCPCNHKTNFRGKITQNNNIKCFLKYLAEEKKNLEASTLCWSFLGVKHTLPCNYFHQTFISLKICMFLHFQSFRNGMWGNQCIKMRQKNIFCQQFSIPNPQKHLLSVKETNEIKVLKCKITIVRLITETVMHFTLIINSVWVKVLGFWFLNSFKVDSASALWAFTSINHFKPPPIGQTEHVRCCLIWSRKWNM